MCKLVHIGGLGPMFEALGIPTNSQKLGLLIERSTYSYIA